MRAAIQTGIRSIEVRDIPVPEPDAETGLIRVRTAGICGSDLHPYHERAEPQTLPAGHEVCGEVMHLPDGYAGPARIGDLVAIDGVLGMACGDCDFCRAGQMFHCPVRQVRPDVRRRLRGGLQAASVRLLPAAGGDDPAAGRPGRAAGGRRPRRAVPTDAAGRERRHHRRGDDRADDADRGAGARGRRRPHHRAPPPAGEAGDRAWRHRRPLRRRGHGRRAGARPDGRPRRGPGRRDGRRPRRHAQPRLGPGQAAGHGLGARRLPGADPGRSAASRWARRSG